jgi:putative endonuclease
VKEQFYVYVLCGKNGIFYKGMSNNLERRLKEHFLGKSMTTKKLLPLDLVFVQICENRKEARELEKYLKSGSGREIIREFLLI